MDIKVCGIRTAENLAFLETSSVSQIGFIFYDKSKRNFEDGYLTSSDVSKITTTKVGVFVNATESRVMEVVKTYQLDVVQLHGSESPSYCSEIRKQDVKVWKAFPVYDQLPDNLSLYLDSIDVFLFDTKGQEHGGNGVKFDWNVLESYRFEKPFILSGGIGPEDALEIKKLAHPSLIGIDINSKFEIEPGFKNQDLLKKFIKEVKNED